MYTMQLIGTKTSPYVRKVRVSMLEKQLDFQFTLQDPWKPEDRVQDANPLGKVPCLILPTTGNKIFDSRVIVEYLDTLSPTAKLLPDSGWERIEVKIWEALADGILEAAIAIRLENVFAGRSESQRSPAWIAYQTEKVRAGIATMEQKLTSHVSAFCAGDGLTLADIAVGCMLGWLDFRFADFDWRYNHPHLVRLHDKLMQRKSFMDTVPEV